MHSCIYKVNIVVDSLCNPIGGECWDGEERGGGKVDRLRKVGKEMVEFELVKSCFLITVVKNKASSANGGFVWKILHPIKPHMKVIIKRLISCMWPRRQRCPTSGLDQSSLRHFSRGLHWKKNSQKSWSCFSKLKTYEILRHWLYFQKTI